MGNILINTFPVECFDLLSVSTLPNIPLKPIPKKDWTHFPEDESENPRECNHYEHGVNSYSRNLGSLIVSCVCVYHTVPIYVRYHFQEPQQPC